MQGQNEQGKFECGNIAEKEKTHRSVILLKSAKIYTRTPYTGDVEEICIFKGDPLQHFPGPQRSRGCTMD